MSLFEKLSLIALVLAGLWAVGAALIGLYSRTKQRADEAERKSLTDSVESVRLLVHSAKTEIMTHVGGATKKAEDLFVKFHEADKVLTKHEAELKRIVEAQEIQMRHFTREFERSWKTLDETRSQVQELWNGLVRVTGTKKKT